MINKWNPETQNKYLPKKFCAQYIKSEFNTVKHG